MSRRIIVEIDEQNDLQITNDFDSPLAVILLSDAIRKLVLSDVLKVEEVSEDDVSTVEE